MSKPRILFIMRSVAHFSYHESTLSALIAHGFELHLAFDKVRSENYSTTLVDQWLKSRNQPTWQWLPAPDSILQSWLSALREIKTYGSYLSREDQSNYYQKRWFHYLPKPVQQIFRLPILGIILKSILKFRWSQRIMKIFISHWPSSPAAMRFILSVDPAAVVASPTNMRYSIEPDFVKAAIQLNIPTFISVLSWDNLTTKGLLHIKPHRLLLWNKTHQMEAIKIHDVPEEIIETTGAPFFDKWFPSRDKKLNVDKAILNRMGVDPNKPYILYLGSSKNIAPDETFITDQLIEAIQSSKDDSIKNFQILIRPHPANAKNYLKYEQIENVAVWPKGLNLSLPDDQKSQEEFMAAVTFAEATIGINTSGMIDAMIMGKPVFAFICEEFTKTQTEAQHFKHLTENQAIFTVHSTLDFLDKMKRLPQIWPEQNKRSQKFIEEFIRPNGIDKPAGQIQADIISQFYKN